MLRIRIRVDPDSNRLAGSGSVFGIRIRILQVKLSYKTPLFQQIFHNFQLFLKIIGTYQIKVPCLLKYLPTLLVENKNKIPTFLVKN